LEPDDVRAFNRPHPLFRRASVRHDPPLGERRFGRADPDTVITGVRTLNTYSERIALDKEVWIAGGRIAAVKLAGTYQGSAPRYDGQGGIIAPGLVDPHLHIESSMVTACAYAEAALLNGTTTIFCDSHEIGNVMDVAGVEAMLEDARQAPLSIFLTVPSTVPATSPELETAGGRSDAGEDRRHF
jgi:adenine deaminase